MKRRHNSQLLRLHVEKRSHGRCEYCHAPQRACAYRFHLEHIKPRSRGGSDASSNRALACAACNLSKSNQEKGLDPRTGELIDLFNPRRQKWEDHFYWASDQETLVGRTRCGRATVLALDMNEELRRAPRKLWFDRGFLP